MVARERERERERVYTYRSNLNKCFIVVVFMCQNIGVISLLDSMLFQCYFD